MTLPFRRRHHDDETSHDRARALTSAEMLDPLSGDDAGWLARHLESCAECRQDREAYLADRALLRSLRDRTPEPPRDLWARTSAAIERESRRRPASARRRRRPMPFGAAASALIVLVVLGVSFLPRLTPPVQPTGSSDVAILPTGPLETPFDVIPGAGRLAWLRPAANGSWELVTAKVDAVCPRTRPSCVPLTEDDPGRSLALAGTPTGVTISPTEDQLVVAARDAGTTADRIYVVQVPPATPAVTPAPTEVATSGTPTAPPITVSPGTPEPSATAAVVLEIASGVMVVGEPAYSSDGKWLAFSARPSDGSTGPDLYLWTVGQPTAVAVTNDHRTYFSEWLGGRILASSVEASEQSVSGAQATTGPTPNEHANASGKPDDSEAHPSSFLLDPATLTRTAIAQPDLWLPVVDATGRYAAYWSGSLVPTADGLDWELGKGNLVLSGWSDGTDAGSSPEPLSETATPDATEVPALGPTGTPVEVVPGHSAAFKAKFDPGSTRLAVWVSEQVDAEVGRLHLVVLDPATGSVVAGPEPLPGAPALRRFSIDVGRLAWVTPSGQDGQESAVQVLGWSSTDFGEIRTIPAKALYIVR